MDNPGIKSVIQVRHTKFKSHAVSELRIGLQMRYLSDISGGFTKLSVSYEPSNETIISEGRALYILQRSIMFKETKEITDLIHKSGGVCICDYDDLLTEIADYNPYKSESVSEDELANVLSCFDAITVSTEFLKKKFLEMNGALKIYVIKNRVPRWMTLSRQMKRNWNVILYSGSASHHSVGMGDWTESWVTALERLSRDGYKLICMGHSVPEFIKHIDGITHLPPMILEDHYYRKASINYGIEISPLAENNFNKSKSNIRAIESMAVGAGFVGSCFDDSPYNGIGYNVPAEASADKIEYAIRKAGSIALDKKYLVESSDTINDWMKLICQISPAQ